MEGKYLITTDNWFFAPDGRQYRAVWGEVEIISDSFLNIKTNIKSSNWFAKVGSEDKFVIIAGCQIHYACKTDIQPLTDTTDTSILNDITEIKKTINTIFIAE